MGTVISFPKINRSEYAANAAMREAVDNFCRELELVEQAEARGQAEQAKLESVSAAWAARRAKERAIQKRCAFAVRVIMAIITVIIFTTLYPPPV